MNKSEVMRLGSNDKSQTKMSKAEVSKKIAKMRERDSEMVTGIFKNLENEARNGCRGALNFGYKAYQGDDYVFYEFLDGEQYTIPRGVAWHLNNNCFYKEYRHLKNETGQEGIREAVPDGKYNNSNMLASRKVHRCAFYNKEFITKDNDMMPVDLVEVSTVP